MDENEEPLDELWRTREEEETPAGDEEEPEEAVIDAPVPLEELLDSEDEEPLGDADEDEEEETGQELLEHDLLVWMTALKLQVVLVTLTNTAMVALHAHWNCTVTVGASQPSVALLSLTSFNVYP